MRLVRILFILLVFVNFTACKTQKTTATTAIVLKAKTTKQLITKHYRNRFNKKTLSAKLKVHYKDTSNTQNVLASLRLIKDKKIWISISAMGYGVAKVIITPDSVSYYERINKTYFKGDFSLLSDFIGTDLDFDKVQNLLVGQSILNLKKTAYKSHIADKTYVLEPEKQQDLYNLILALNPINFKIAKEEISQGDQSVVLEYASYQTISRTTIPQKLNIKVNDGINSAAIRVLYKAVKLNKKLKMPFKIPSGFKERTIN